MKTEHPLRPILHIHNEHGTTRAEVHYSAKSGLFQITSSHKETACVPITEILHSNPVLDHLLSLVNAQDYDSQSSNAAYDIFCRHAREFVRKG